jgi:hypothetical protein
LRFLLIIAGLDPAIPKITLSSASLIEIAGSSPAISAVSLYPNYGVGL